MVEKIYARAASSAVSKVSSHLSAFALEILAPNLPLDCGHTPRNLARASP
jgi:hypothetical protein